MSKFLASDLREAAQTCALCHDQCISSCPVVSATRSQTAYPSRLATIALEMDYGRLLSRSDVFLALQACVQCSLCTYNCVYQEAPNDIIPVIRSGRAYLVEQGCLTPGLEELLQALDTWGNPYGDVQPALSQLSSTYPQNTAAGQALLFVGAPDLLWDSESVEKTLDLLARMGYESRISTTVYAGEELWHYGLMERFAQLARHVVTEIEQIAPQVVISLSPASAKLLREVYPKILGIGFTIPVFTLVELAITLLDLPSLLQDENNLSGIHLASGWIGSPGEIFPIVGAPLGLSFLVEAGWRYFAFPEGLALDLEPRYSAGLKSRLATWIETVPGVIVSGHAHAWQAICQLKQSPRAYRLPEILLEKG